MQLSVQDSVIIGLMTTESLTVVNYNAVFLSDIKKTKRAVISDIIMYKHAQHT